MADLSQLSDEQLSVYRDLVAKKSGDGAAPAPVQAPPQPSIGQRALSNLPRSIANLAQNAFPVQNEQLPIDPAQRHVRGPFEEIGNAASYLGNMIMHPQESFANDPAGTVAIPAMVAHGGIQSMGGYRAAGAAAKGAAKGALEDITGPTKYHYRGIPLPIGVAAPAGVGYLAGGHEGALVGAGLGAAATGLRGAIRGGKQGLQDYRYSQIDKTPNIVAPIEHPTPPPIEPIRGPLPSGRTVGPAPPPPPRPAPTAVAPIEHPAPPPIQSIQGPLPSGRAVGGIANQKATGLPPLVPKIVAPIEHPVPPAIESIQGPLPSGRKVGGLANQKPIAPPTAQPSGPSQLELEDIARSMGGKSWARLTPSEQAGARRILEASHAQKGVIASPSPAPSGTIPVPKPTVEGAVTKLDMPQAEPYKSFSPSRVKRQTTPQEGTKPVPTLGERLKNNPAAMRAAKAAKKGTK